jgi:Phage-related protein
MKFDIEIYVKADGTKPVREFLDSLEDKMRAKVTRGIWLLGEYGNELREPDTKYLGDGILELRIKQANNISRVLYFFMQDRKIVLTHGFIKKTQKTPTKEIRRSKKYRKEYIARTKEVL